MAKKTSKKPVKKSLKKKSDVQITIPEEVSFEYIKSNHFRVIRLDGVHGGLGPKANTVQMALFSERQAIPRRETFKVKDGSLQVPPKEIEGRNAIIREIEIEAIMDIPTAKTLKQWLDKKIRTAEKINKKMQSGKD